MQRSEGILSSLQELKAKCYQNYQTMLHVLDILPSRNPLERLVYLL